MFAPIDYVEDDVSQRVLASIFHGKLGTKLSNEFD